MIKNSALVVKDETTENGTVITIKRHSPNLNNREVKMSDVFEFLPSGFVHKEETGIGATTLELISSRNSIIVEPIRVTASSKAKDKAALYVGSETRLHPKTSRKDIQNYVSDTAIAYKKIIVVADSLGKVTEVIGESVFTDYFLMIDEIDSFQLDSSYRGSMEKCIDIYKAFPKNARAMVSATTLDFSDPTLAEEKQTHIKYDVPTYRNIQLVYAGKRIKDAVLTQIVTLNKLYPNDKIMVAYNSVAGCLDIATHLANNSNINKNEIKILCSTSSTDKVGDYFSELESKELPAKINFLTSAYFTGFDLEEQYHLISVSGNINRIHSLSVKRLKQIAGRCRHIKGLFSETIVYDCVPKDEQKDIKTVEELTNTAKAEISALECINSHYQEYPLLRESADYIRELITQNTSTLGHQFVRLKSKIPVISYLNIDAYLETNKTRYQLYTSKDILPMKLKADGHSVELKSVTDNLKVEDNKVDKQNREVQIKQIIEAIKRARELSISPLDLLYLKEVQLSSLQKLIVKKYNEVYEYLDSDQLLDLIQEAGNTRDSRQLNNLFLSTYYVTLSTSAHYKRQVKFHIPLKKSFTGEELLLRWNLIFDETGLHKRLDSPTSAVRFTNLHYKTIKRRRPKICHYIAEENPLKLSQVKFRPYVTDEKDPITNIVKDTIDILSA
jgi:hypothetical protein